MKRKKLDIGLFEKYLTVWVALCIITGVLIGKFIPVIPAILSKFEYANVSIPIAVLIWLMIYPMMLKVDFTTIGKHIRAPKGLTITLVSNWFIKPFTMYAIAWFFFNTVFKDFITSELSKEYLAGAVLLGAAPCTAMVFVWSQLTNGSPSYTVLQVAINDLVILIAFTPIVAFLLGISNIIVPYKTLFLSVLLFVVIPLSAGYLSRKIITGKKGEEYFKNVFIAKFNNTTIGGLLLTLVIIFSFQGGIILSNPLHIALIAVPLTIQTFLIFSIAYGWAKLWKTKHEIAAPSALIGASNFFELAVAVAVSLFGLESGAALVTVVGVLVEVPIMLSLVRIANKTKHLFNFSKDLI